MNFAICRDDLLWLAGVIDGEGTITYVKKTNRGVGTIYIYYYPELSIMNPDVEYLKTIQKAIGSGNIYIQKQHKTYLYTLLSSKLVLFSIQVLPFLRREYQRLRMIIASEYENGNPVKNKELYLSIRRITVQMGGSSIYVKHNE